MNTIEGATVPTKALAILESGESARFAARPDYATVSVGDNWSGALLLLTDQRLILVKDRLFGKPRADFQIPWRDVQRVEGELWKGGGPKIQLHVHNSQTSDPIELIVRPEHAVDVESAIRSGYIDIKRG
jgi:hypothetical protein